MRRQKLHGGQSPLISRLNGAFQPPVNPIFSQGLFSSHLFLSVRFLDPPPE